MDPMILSGTRSVAIKRMLARSNATDLYELYSASMECQVLVAKDDGYILSKEYKGPAGLKYTNDRETWYSFRIPKNAMSEPEGNDLPMTYDLAAHAEAIGMTGWNWAEKRSVFVAYDFDSILTHSSGISLAEMDEIKERASAIPWVTVRRSTSGSGLHLYVFLDSDEVVENHTQHAALARSVLNLMSSEAGYNFQQKVDICGGNMWCWARKMEGTDGLKLIKTGEKLVEIPTNWRDHVPVIQKRSSRIMLGNDEVTAERRHITLDEDHKRIIRALEGTLSWWDSDRNLLVTHTSSLKQVFSELVLKGMFDTISSGKASGQDYNCFCVPLPNGAFVVYRFSSVQEHPTWFRDSRGVSYTYFNREPDLPMLAKAFQGIERERGGYIFDSVETALMVLQGLGIFPEIDHKMLARQTVIQEHKDGRILVKIQREDRDSALSGWEPTKDKMWTRIFSQPVRTQHDEIPVSTEINDTVRHIVNTSGQDAGWMLSCQGQWNQEPLQHIRLALKSQNNSAKEIDQLVGIAVTNYWTEVCKPFAPEYPGNREWNRHAPQFIVTPSTNEERSYPTWMSIFQHCGESLDIAVGMNNWCKAHGIHRGSDYLKCWVASLFQYPEKPLPYLFLYGPQNSGKSIFHEALSLLFSPGYVRADNAVTNPGNFTGELHNAVLCVIEETDLRQNKTAYNRIKDWVTGLQLVVHIKGQTPYQVPNVTHWIQCSNDRQACPIFPGDTRIVVLEVPALSSSTPKEILISKLRAEAGDFLAELLSLELPQSPDRLNLPPIGSEQKNIVMEANTNMLEVFIRDRVKHINGFYTSVKDFTEAFHATLDPVDQVYWTKQRIGKEMPTTYPKGRLVGTPMTVFGNMSLTEQEPKDFTYMLSSGGVLIKYANSK